MPANFIAAFGGALVKRASEKPYPGDGGDGAPTGQLPGWAVLVFFADFLVFFPILIYIGYTLSHIYPTLAMIEDPQPPAYTAVSLAEDPTAADDDNAATPKVDASPALITTSLRRINRLLYATAGWPANFRGLWCALAMDAASVFCGGVVGSVLPRAAGVLVAALATVQLHTAWTHIVVTVPSPLRWWRRLPPFGKTFRATWLPVTAYWAAEQFTRFASRALSVALGLARWDPANPAAVPDFDGHALWKSLLVLLVTIACAVGLVAPAQVVLVRVQASLLPADADTIVPFDRSFSGAVEPEVVTGKGYVDFVTAWRTFERDSWVRLMKLAAKIVGVTLAVYVLFLAIVVPEYILMLKVVEPGVAGGSL